VLSGGGQVQGQGLTIPQACKRIGISDQTFYRWRLNCGALKEDEAQRLKALDRNHMRVRVHREADLGMTEHVHDHSGRNVIMDLEGVEFNETNTLSKSARAILGRD
jgi:transposase-like protein